MLVFASQRKGQEICGKVLGVKSSLDGKQT